MNHFEREEQDLKQLISKNEVLVTFQLYNAEVVYGLPSVKVITY